MENFTQVPNEILDNNSLTAQEIGVLSILVRNIPDWKIYLNEISNRTNNGIDFYRNILKSLEEKGFIEKIIEGGGRNEEGKFNKSNIYWKLKKHPQRKTNTGLPINGNQYPKTNIPFSDANNTNSNNTNSNNTKTVTVTVSNGFPNTVNKKKYFFNPFEIPTFHQVEEYIVPKGYSSEDASDIHKAILNSNERVKYVDSFIDKLLKTKKQVIKGTELEKLIYSYADCYTSQKGNLDPDYFQMWSTTNRLNMREIVDECVQVCGKDKFAEHIQTGINGYHNGKQILSPSKVKEAILKHHQSVGSKY
jgi:hypothetical protein